MALTGDSKAVYQAAEQAFKELKVTSDVLKQLKGFESLLGRLRASVKLV